VAGFAQDTNGRDSFVIIGAFNLLLIRCKHYLSCWSLSIPCGRQPDRHPLETSLPTAVGASTLPKCHMRIAKRRMLATTATFFFLGFFALIRS
jgi:hypothetical protein